MAQTYTVKKGDTLNKIAGQYGFKNYKDAGISGYGNNPDLIKVGQVITIGGTKAPTVAPKAPTATPYVSTTPAPKPKATVAPTGTPGATVPPAGGQNMTAIINGNQDTDIESFTNNEVPTKENSLSSPLTDTYGDLTELLTGNLGEKPKNPGFLDTYNKLRGDLGVNDLEKSLADLNTEEENLVAQKRISTNAELGKPVALNVIEGRVGEQERNFNERIDVVSREKSRVANQVKSAYDTIDTVMKYSKMDFDTARDDYDKQFSQNLQMFNATQSVMDKQQDNARSNAQIVINSLVESGTPYEQLTPETKTLLTKLGVQSGLGSGFFIDAMKASDKPILTHKFNDDGTVTVVYKDLTTKTLKTGAPASSTKQTSTETKAEKENDIADAILRFKDQIQEKKWAGINPDEYKFYKDYLKKTYGAAAVLELDKAIADAGLKIDYKNT